MEKWRFVAPLDQNSAPTHVSVVGYGTFITERWFERGKNAEACLVRGFRRIMPPGHPYPFILPANLEDGFWGIKFDVNFALLAELDAYEECPTLYLRESIQVELRSGAFVLAEIYVPTPQTVEQYCLSPDIDPSDHWRAVITREVPDLLEKFPELSYEVE